MATPITWQSIARPDFDSVNKGLLQTAALFNSAVEGFKDPLKEANATVQQNWNQGKENNTNALLNKFAGFKTAEEAQAALESGAVAEMLGGYGAQVDGSAVRAAQQNLVSNLQKKAIEADTYQQAQLAASERDNIGAVRARIAVGDYEGANSLMAESPLSKATQAVLSKDIFNHQQVVAEAKAKQEAAASTLLTQAAQRDAWKATSETQRAQVIAAQTRADAEEVKAKVEFLKALEASNAKDVAENSVLGLGSMGDANFEKVIGNTLKTLFPDDKDTQAKTWGIIKEVFPKNQFDYKSPNTGKNVNEVVPTKTVQDAIVEASRYYGWGTGKVGFGLGGTYSGSLKEILEAKSTDDFLTSQVEEARRKDIQFRNSMRAAAEYGKNGPPEVTTKTPYK